MKEDNRSRGSTIQLSKLNMDNPLNCPHDLTKLQEFRDDLPTLISKKPQEEKQKINNNLLKSKAAVSVFNSDDNLEIKHKNGTLNSLKFLSPYQRYINTLYKLIGFLI